MIFLLGGLLVNLSTFCKKVARKSMLGKLVRE